MAHRFEPSPNPTPGVASVMDWVWLGLLGIAIGALGTLIGAGGGFLLMPILVLLYPHDEPETLASISLAVVCLNAMSGSYGYARQKLVDFNAGKFFMLAGIPGAVAGSFVTALLPRTVFDICLGGALIVIAVIILATGALRPPAHAAHPTAPRDRRWLLKGIAISFVVGFVSTLPGIGGGIIHVPAMVYVLDFPVHAAAATSHFVLAGTALSGTLAHLATGAFAHGLKRTIALGLGAIIGAQIGAHFAKRTPPTWIMRGLGLALGVVGARVVWMALTRIPPP